MVAERSRMQLHGMRGPRFRIPSCRWVLQFSLHLTNKSDFKEHLVMSVGQISYSLSAVKGDRISRSPYANINLINNVNSTMGLCCDESKNNHFKIKKSNQIKDGRRKEARRTYSIKYCYKAIFVIMKNR